MDVDPENNFFSAGVRVIGEGHKIYNNYIEGANNRGSNAAGAINISNGKPNSALKEYFTVKNVQIVFFKHSVIYVTTKANDNK